MTPNSRFTLGVDLAQSSIQASIAFDLNDIKRPRELPTCAIEGELDSPQTLATLRQWIEQTVGTAQCVCIVVESTGRLSERFAKACVNAGLMRPAIINPAWIKAFGTSMGTHHKTDVDDAAVIALYGVVHCPHSAKELSPAHARLRELNRLRESILTQQTALKNQLRVAVDDFARRSVQALLDCYKEQIKGLENEMDSIIKDDALLSKQCKALQEVRGIGPVLSHTLTAELGDLRQYRRNQLVALAGVFPRQHTSGSSVWHAPRMNKRGGGRLRRVLYMAATSLFHSHGPWRDFIDRNLKRGLKKMQIIGALMRKLLLVARTVVINGGQYDESKICSHS